MKASRVKVGKTGNSTTGILDHWGFFLRRGSTENDIITNPLRETTIVENTGRSSPGERNCE
jgi:hypothetical protein